MFKICNEIGKLYGNVRKESVKNLLRLRAICTPEQIQKLNTINNELIAPESSMHRMGKRKGPSEKKQSK